MRVADAVHLARGTLLLAVALVTSACQQGDSPAHDALADAVDPLCIADVYGDSTGEIPFEDFERAYKEAGCSFSARCGESPDETTCLARATSSSWSWFSPDVTAAIRAGYVTYNARHAKACIDALAATPCLRTDAESKKVDQLCSGITEGTVRSGGICRIAEECVSQVCDGSSCYGTCKGDAPPIVQACLGGSCTSERGCGDNMYCDEERRCVALKGEGDDCTTFDDNSFACQPGLACVWGSHVDAECVRIPSLGQACVFGMCDLATTCDPTTSTCQPPRQLGEACAAKNQCVWDHFCDPNTGTCTKRPSVGQACTLDSWCSGGACDLDTQKCVEVKPNGPKCRWD